jgi:hypothetical protein
LQPDVLGRDWEPVKIKRPRREIKLPVILSVGEVERFIMATTNLKHRALLALAYSAGLRSEETQKTPGLLKTYFKAVKPSQFLFKTSFAFFTGQLSISLLLGGRLIKHLNVVHHKF